MILALIGQVGAQAGIGYAVEFGGSAVRNLPIEGRMTLCNMSIEFFCKYGFVPPDHATLEYLHGRPCSPKGQNRELAQKHWRGLRSVDEATFDLEVRVNCDALEPQVPWGTSPEHVAAVSARVPDADEMPDAETRQLARRSLEYMRLAPDRPLLRGMVWGTRRCSSNGGRLAAGA